MTALSVNTQKIPFFDLLTHHLQSKN